MDLRIVYIVTYCIDGVVQVDDNVFSGESLANKRKDVIENQFSTNYYFEGASIQTCKLVYDRGFGLNKLWRIDYIKSGELWRSPFYNSEDRANNKYNEILDRSPSISDISLEVFYPTGSCLVNSNKIGTLDY